MRQYFLDIKKFWSTESDARYASQSSYQSLMISKIELLQAEIAELRLKHGKANRQACA